MKKLIKTLILFSIILLVYIPYSKVYAANEDEKVIEVPIEKNYKSAKFTLTFDYYDNYSVVLRSPSKKEYIGTLESDNVVQCVAEDVEVGQWKVIISRESPRLEYETEQDNSNESSEDSGTDEEKYQMPISPVKLKVEGSYESFADVSKDISVATDIVGLKMYFKDDSFVAEWTDTTCGNVNIEVINSKNLQKLDAQRIEGNYYELPLKDNIQEILVKIVPAVSSSIEGATNSYTFKVENNPNATVNYEDILITNHDSTIVTCELCEKYGVQIFVNDSIVEKTELLDKGVYEIEVPIDIGENSIVTYIVDEKGNMKSTSYSITKDVIAPQLSLASTYEDIVTQDEFITLEGKVEDFESLTINNVEIEVEGDSTFKYDYKLKDGINQIAIVANDVAGNETEYVIAVERVIPEEKSVPPYYLGVILIIIALIAGYFLFSKRKSLEHGKISTNNDRPSKRTVKEVNNEDDYTSEYDNVDISNLTPREKNIMCKGPYFMWDIVSVAVPFIAAYIVLSYIIFVSVVQSESMHPTLKVGNTVFYNRLAYVRSEPKRGDAVVFYSEEYGEYFGKRIIGIPGDHIEFKDGYVVINGQYCDETAYISSEIETNCTKIFDVPEGSYFMLGDNREHSNDSRYWTETYIPQKNIKGKYMGQIAFSFQYDVFGKLFGTGNKSNDKIKQIEVEESTAQVQTEEAESSVIESTSEIESIVETETMTETESITETETITEDEESTETATENNTETEFFSEESMTDIVTVVEKK